MTQTFRVLGLAAILGLVGCIKTDRERAEANGAKPLTRQQALDQFSGNTLVGIIPQYNLTYAVFYNPDGRITGTINGPMNDDARGSWQVNDQGQVCNEWNKESWKSGPPCNSYWHEGDEYKVFQEKGGIVSVAKLEKGNARKLEMRSDLEIAKAAGTLEVLTAEYLREQIPGNTVSGMFKALDDAKYHAHYGQDGSIAAKIPAATEDDKGRYRITDEGQVCVKWSRWADGVEHCGHWYRDGKKIKVFDDGGSLGLTGKFRKGNPEKLSI